MALFPFFKRKTSEKPSSVTPSSSNAEQTQQPSFCLWQPTPEDPSFAKSPVLPLLDELFELTSGNELHIFNGTALIGGTRLDTIPKEEAYLQIRYQGTLMLLSLSEEKGLRFRFDYSTTPVKQICDTLSKEIAFLKQNGISSATPFHEPTGGKIWWQMIKQRMLSQPDHEKIQAIGLLANFKKET